MKGNGPGASQLRMSCTVGRCAGGRERITVDPWTCVTWWWSAAASRARRWPTSWPPPAAVTLLEAEPELGRHSTARSAATWIPGHGTDVVRALIAASGPRFARLADELDAPPLLRPLDVLWVAFDELAEPALAAMLAERAGEPDTPVALTPAEAEECAPTLRPGRLRAAARSTRGRRRHRRAAPGLRARPQGAGRCRADRRPRRGRSPVTAPGGGSRTSPRASSSTRLGRGPTSSPTGRACPASACSPTVGRSRSPGCPTAPGCAAPWSARPPSASTTRSKAPTCSCRPPTRPPPSPATPVPTSWTSPSRWSASRRPPASACAPIRTSWAGLRSFVPDRRPVVGAWPDHPGFAFVAGQGGSGIETAPALAALAAAVLTGAAPPADVPVDPAALAPVRG